MILYKKRGSYKVWEINMEVCPHLKFDDITLICGLGYCKFGNFREDFIFANSVKTRICDVENS